MQPRPGRVAPPASVKGAWAAQDPQPISGGQETAFVTDELVLKPVRDVRTHECLADVLDALEAPQDLRIIRPVRARTGEWIVDGWSAWERLDGAVDRRRWREALAVSERFHSTVARIGWSGALAGEHPWAHADAFAWGEREIDVPRPSQPLVGGLREQRVQIDVTNQLIHGDLGGNILFHPELPPAVIDVSPYWRPKRYADAIVIVDAIAWSGAGPEALEPLCDDEGQQMLNPRRAIPNRGRSPGLRRPRRAPGRRGGGLRAGRACPSRVTAVAGSCDPDP